MKFYVIFCLIFPLLASSINGEDLEEFPLDFDEDRQSGDPGAETQPGGDTNKISGSSSFQSLEQQRNDVMKRVVANAMNKPGAKLRLSQVMPILRTMSGPQRLALAALVSAQVMASPREPLPPPHDPHHNATAQLMLPISQDIAAMFRGAGRDDSPLAGRSNEIQVQQRSRQSYNTINNNLVLNRREGHVPKEILAPPPPPHHTRHPPSRSHQQAGSSQGHGQDQMPPQRSLAGGEPTNEDCEFFTSSLCLEDTNYPKGDILKSLRNSQNKEAFSSLLQDAKYDIKDLDSSVNDHIERRQGDTSMIDNSKMCASRVEMAKPKRARTTMGNWKYIVNTGDYSQSLRLEMCLRPQASCSYIAPGVRSECMQVYNYHRLLTWDQNNGLAMDMFKVPTCCSCHIQNSFMAQQSPRPPMPSGLPTMFPESGPESNFITSELMSQAMQRLPPGVLQGMRMRGDMNLLGHHNIPKRESNSPNSGGAPLSRRPQASVIHRGPPLPLQEENPEPPPRYPPYHNNVRRTSLRNQSADRTEQAARAVNRRSSRNSSYRRRLRRIQRYSE
ncbi:hypothetical protein LSTR_LSTR006023 [Laodelphax striatellus]|uniref:Uncharacterized protein n=1 Tax=Laodelphax striatellus TaxID=195883 RepID=A0A482XQN4_LAOST|nr:hypothetical protein LSTR_LSTR006023 [Laodelphax striatellus]